MTLVAAWREQQVVEPTTFRKRVERAMADPIKEHAVGVEQFLRTIDQDAERQMLEQRVSGRVARLGHRALRCGVGAPVNAFAVLMWLQRRRRGNVVRCARNARRIFQTC